MLETTYIWIYSVQISCNFEFTMSLTHAVMFGYSPQFAMKSYVYPDYFLLLSFWRLDSTIASIGNLIIWKLLNAMGMGISRAPFPFKYIGFLAAPGCDEWTFVRDSPTKIYTPSKESWYLARWQSGNFFQKSGHLKHFALLLQLLLLKFTRFLHTIFTPKTLHKSFDKYNVCPNVK